MQHAVVGFSNKWSACCLLLLVSIGGLLARLQALIIGKQAVVAMLISHLPPIEGVICSTFSNAWHAEPRYDLIQATQCTRGSSAAARHRSSPAQQCLRASPGTAVASGAASQAQCPGCAASRPSRARRPAPKASPRSVKHVGRAAVAGARSLPCGCCRWCCMRS